MAGGVAPEWMEGMRGWRGGRMGERGRGEGEEVVVEVVEGGGRGCEGVVEEGEIRGIAVWVVEVGG